jgi:hypothetical protein
MRSVAIVVPIRRTPLQRVIEWLAPWYDTKAEDARSEAVEMAVADAKVSARRASAAVRAHQAELRDSMRRASERLGGR